MQTSAPLIFPVINSCLPVISRRSMFPHNKQSCSRPTSDASCLECKQTASGGDRLDLVPPALRLSARRSRRRRTVARARGGRETGAAPREGRDASWGRSNKINHQRKVLMGVDMKTMLKNPEGIQTNAPRLSRCDWNAAVAAGTEGGSAELHQLEPQLGSKVKGPRLTAPPAGHMSSPTGIPHG